MIPSIAMDHKQSIKRQSFTHCWFGLVSLFNGISTFVGYLMTKPFFSKKISSNI